MYTNVCSHTQTGTLAHFTWHMSPRYNYSQVLALKTKLPRFTGPTSPPVDPAKWLHLSGPSVSSLVEQG